VKKVSVIVTTYGGGSEVKRAVLSLINQTCGNHEIIVVDDNGLGTEAQIKTENCLSEFIENNKIKYVPHEVNRNGACARNTGFKNSQGEYIMFLDDDDEYTPERIEKQVAILDGLDSSWGVSYCSFKKVDKNGKVFEKMIAKKSGKMLYNAIMHRPTLLTCNTMIRREAYEAVEGFDETFRRHQDWEFFARLTEKYKAKAMKDFGCIIHMEFRNSAKNLDTVREYRLKYLEKIKPQIKALPPIYQKRVVAENMYDLAMQRLKSEGLKGFLKEYKKIGLGYFGIEFLVRRVYYILRQKLLSKLNGLK